ncbi:Na/Pi symporter [Peribacillus tepidiphilus]|uniref:Na/Pi symporter n=1 Tax=Peribacillus tepidiphilus TaxID=2652445 RepID=UPI0035B55773
MRELFLFIVFLLVFLLGMNFLRAGLFNLSGERLKNTLQRVTDKPWKGFIAGTIVTAVLQSSSAVTVMTVGLVSAGSLSFSQTIGIILGSNIGTTVTAEFMTFSLSKWIVPGAVIGALFILFSSFFLRSLGFVIFGMSSIFAAMEGFKSLAIPLSRYDFVSNALLMIENHLLMALLIGMIMTAMIHSSSAMIGICMSFLSTGDLTVSASIAIMLGSNIGTCITAYMASIGAGKEAAFTAYAHIWLNLLGSILFFPFIDELGTAAAFFTSEKNVQLAHASVIFNVICSIIVLPFSTLFATLIIKVHGRKK